MPADRVSRLAAAMAEVRPRQVHGVWHRFVEESYREDADSDRGALDHGGHYNPRGEFGALYLSDTEAACRAEMRHRVGIRPRYWHAQIRVRLQKVLDLTDGSTVQKLGIVPTTLVSLDWLLPQDVARATRAAGFNALIVPSAAGSHRNVVVFKDLLADDEVAETIHVRQIPESQ